MTFEYNVNKNSIEYDGKHFAYCNAEQSKIVRKLNKLHDKYEFLEIKNQSLEHYATKYAKLYHQSSKENEQLKKQLNDKEVEWLRSNTVWEQMPSSKRTFTRTSKR